MEDFYEYDLIEDQPSIAAYMLERKEEEGWEEVARDSCAGFMQIKIRREKNNAQKAKQIVSDVGIFSEDQISALCCMIDVLDGGY